MGRRGMAIKKGARRGTFSMKQVQIFLFYFGKFLYQINELV